MKFELNRKQNSGVMDCVDFTVSIRRTEFLKNYELNKEETLEEVNTLIEMYCSPNCFCRQISETTLENIAKNFKPKYHSIFFDIEEDHECKPDLIIGYIVKD